MKFPWIIFPFFLLIISGCSGRITPLPDTDPAALDLLLPTPFISKTPTQTSTPTHTPAPTLTPVLTTTPDIAATSTFSATAISGSVQSFSNDRMELVYVPAGQFWMGSLSTDQLAYQDEKPQRYVYLDAYWISRTEVTNTMYSDFVESIGHVTGAEGRGWMFHYDIVEANLQRMNGANWRHPYGPSSSLDGLEAHPVVGIDWQDAQAYCHWAGGRLPTEAEWEKAARGVTGALYPWGEAQLTGNLANIADRRLGSEYSDMNLDDGYRITAPVGSFPAGASPYDVLDMAGNAWEWVYDWYDAGYYAGAPFDNPTGPENGDYRVIRGGGWNGVARLARAANRGYAFPDVPNNLIGFRCVLQDGG